MSVPLQYEIVKTDATSNGTQFTLLQKLYRIGDSLKENFEITNNNSLLAVYSSVQNFSIYMVLVEFDLKMANSNKRLSKDGVEDLNRKSKLIDDIVEQQDNNNPSSSTAINVATKKNPKTQRSDNTRLMLMPETKEDVNEKDLGE